MCSAHLQLMNHHFIYIKNYCFFNNLIDYKLVSNNFYYSKSLNSLKYGCFNAYLAVILSSLSYVNIYFIKSTKSLGACGIKLSNPVPTLYGKLISICVACFLNLSSILGFGVPSIL
jgi:hypothetical protein